jgi:hypothetical protein
MFKACNWRGQIPFKYGIQFRVFWHTIRMQPLVPIALFVLALLNIVNYKKERSRQRSLDIGRYYNT